MMGETSATPHAAAGPGLVVDAQAAWGEERRALGLDDGASASALCLSGGGIRSAAFGLGVLQALAKRSLLHQFHYLSTVSGGGYIGGWLTRAIAQPSNGGRPLEDVLARILKPQGGADPAPVSNLRRYTSFLSPQGGLASMDSWAGLVLWLRNTLVNWLVFFPLMLSVTAAPLSYFAAATALAAAFDGSDAGARVWAGGLACLAGVVGLGCFGFGVFWSCVDLPSHSHADAADTQAGEAAKAAGFQGKSPRAISHGIVWPVWAWALLAPLAMAPLIDPCEARGDARSAAIGWQVPGCAGPIPFPPGQAGRSPFDLALVSPSLWLPMGSVLVLLSAFGLAWWTVTRPKAYQRGTLTAEQKADARRKHSEAFKKNGLGWLVSALVSAGLLWLGADLARGHSALWLACLGPCWVLVAEVIRSTLYLAFRIEGLRSDLDREWLARLNAEKLRGAAVIGVVSGASLSLPHLLLDHGHAVWHWLVAAVGLLAGPAAAFVGKSAKTVFAPGTKEDAPTSWVRPDTVVAVAVALFALALLMLLGRLAAELSRWATVVGPSPAAQFATLAAAGLGLAVGCVWLAWLVDKRVELNRFSMHAVYRNRIVRAFLGSARSGPRLPDGFTGFDPGDDVRVADVLDEGSDGEGGRRPQRNRLFPVINVALNMTSGSDTARAERKAESFCITPLRCGAPCLRLRVGGAVREGAFVATDTFAGQGLEAGPQDKEKGLTLGTAMTISGAAVSPNMGYQSSVAAAFVMTLFNVRLGAWLPNPNIAPPVGTQATDAAKAELNRSGPLLALSTLLDELGGRSDTTTPYVYLSDGGHFDNLGLYEMLRRRCATILVVDAGRDEHYAYADLGRALQCALIDLGIGVHFVRSIKIGDAALPQYGAYAEIAYPAADAQLPASRGRLVYLKPWLPPGAPTELQAFKAMKASFPHESTADQFFTESDFESYRRLGEYLLEELLGEALRHSDKETLLRSDPLDLEQFFAGMENSART